MAVDLLDPLGWPKKKRFNFPQMAAKWLSAPDPTDILAVDHLKSSARAPASPLRKTGGHVEPQAMFVSSRKLRIAGQKKKTQHLVDDKRSSPKIWVWQTMPQKQTQVIDSSPFS